MKKDSNDGGGYQLSDESLNILDKIKIEAVDNILKRRTGLQGFQVNALEKHKKNTQRNIESRNKAIEQKNTPFAELLKDYKMEEK